MKTASYFLRSILVLFALSASLAAHAERPNFVVILVDDAALMDFLALEPSTSQDSCLLILKAIRMAETRKERARDGSSPPRGHKPRSP